MPYIYKITNLINNKLYIGKTSHSIEERFKTHIIDSNRYYNEKRPLYDAFHKYGIENFIIEEIEQVTSDEIACEREQFWINELKTYIGFENSNGYNATLGGDSRRLYDYKEICEKYLELKNQKEVAKYFNCSEDTVRLALKENNIKIFDNKKKIKRIGKKSEKIFPSITEAALSIPNKNPETVRKNISRALQSGGIGYGFLWEYIE